MSDTGRILLADDEPTFLNATADLLRREGFECETVPDGTASRRPRAAPATIRTAPSMPTPPPSGRKAPQERHALRSATQRSRR